MAALVEAHDAVDAATWAAHAPLSAASPFSACTASTSDASAGDAAPHVELEHDVPSAPAVCAIDAAVAVAEPAYGVGIKVRQM